jgi:hypothetical protein
MTTKKFTDLKENYTNVSLYTGDRTGVEYALEANFRTVFGTELFKTLVTLSRKDGGYHDNL